MLEPEKLIWKMDVVSFPVWELMYIKVFKLDIAIKFLMGFKNYKCSNSSSTWVSLFSNPVHLHILRFFFWMFQIKKLRDKSTDSAMHACIADFLYMTFNVCACNKQSNYKIKLFSSTQVSNDEC